jgi:hypothetical protein
MSDDKLFKVLALGAAAAAVAKEASSAVQPPLDPPLPVCVDGATDVAGCSIIFSGNDLYQGCPIGQTDCANEPGQDDQCCANILPGVPNDNIDHAYCADKDAPRGGICFIGVEPYPPPP